MENQNIKEFLKRIEKLNLNNSEKKRMLRLFQVRINNKTNKVMSYSYFKEFTKNKNFRITKMVLGPKWQRLLFIDIEIA